MKWPSEDLSFTKYWRGDKRLREMFALWPRECEDGMVRWLEKIVVEEVYAGQTLMGDYWIPRRYLPIKDVFGKEG